MTAHADHYRPHWTARAGWLAAHRGAAGIAALAVLELLALSIRFNPWDFGFGGHIAGDALQPLKYVIPGLTGAVGAFALLNRGRSRRAVDALIASGGEGRRAVWLAVNLAFLAAACAPVGWLAPPEPSLADAQRALAAWIAIA
ncbi:MAG: hypothetical protein MI723_10155, partial [Caulobacterales bacterium]|nr:hypothetical protein [Caulobacterales bacterium]